MEVTYERGGGNGGKVLTGGKGAGLDLSVHHIAK